MNTRPPSSHSDCSTYCSVKSGTINPVHTPAFCCPPAGTLPIGLYVKFCRFIAGSMRLTARFVKLMDVFPGLVYCCPVSPIPWPCDPDSASTLIAPEVTVSVLVPVMPLLAPKIEKVSPAFGAKDSAGPKVAVPVVLTALMIAERPACAPPVKMMVCPASTLLGPPNCDNAGALSVVVENVAPTTPVTSPEVITNWSPTAGAAASPAPVNVTAPVLLIVAIVAPLPIWLPDVITSICPASVPIELL